MTTALTPELQQLRQQIEQIDQVHAQGLVSDALHQETRQRLERELVERLLAAPAARSGVRPGLPVWGGIVAFMVAVGGAGYWWAGSPAAVGAGAPVPMAAAPASAPHALGNEQMLAMVETLAERLKAKPDDAEGWGMLARSYATLGRAAEALPAYERALKLAPKDAQLMADYADALALQQGRQLTGAPMDWVRKALAADPKQPKALLLAGTEAFNRKDFAQAIKFWEPVVQGGPPDNALVQQARAGLEDARQALGVAPAAAGNEVLASLARLGGTVRLAPALAAQAKPEDTVFIFARPAQGARMPLALLQRRVKDLPLRFELDDSMAMSPQARLSGAREVIVSARISRSGQAQPQPGDLEGVSAPVAVGSMDLQLEIASVVK